MEAGQCASNAYNTWSIITGLFLHALAFPIFAAPTDLDGAYILLNLRYPFGRLRVLPVVLLINAGDVFFVLRL